MPRHDALRVAVALDVHEERMGQLGNVCRVNHNVLFAANRASADDVRNGRAVRHVLQVDIETAAAVAIDTVDDDNTSYSLKLHKKPPPF